VALPCGTGFSGLVGGVSWWLGAAAPRLFLMGRVGVVFGLVVLGLMSHAFAGLGHGVYRSPNAALEFQASIRAHSNGQSRGDSRASQA
jgi:hypothetical protein